MKSQSPKWDHWSSAVKQTVDVFMDMAVKHLQEQEQRISNLYERNVFLEAQLRSCASCSAAVAAWPRVQPHGFPVAMSWRNMCRHNHSEWELQPKQARMRARRRAREKKKARMQKREHRSNKNACICNSMGRSNRSCHQSRMPIMNFYHEETVTLPPAMKSAAGSKVSSQYLRW
eukprot:g25919.t1